MKNKKLYFLLLLFISAKLLSQTEKIKGNWEFIKKEHVTSETVIIKKDTFFIINKNVTVQQRNVSQGLSSENEASILLKKSGNKIDTLIKGERFSPVKFNVVSYLKENKFKRMTDTTFTEIAKMDSISISNGNSPFEEGLEGIAKHQINHIKDYVFQENDSYYSLPAGAAHAMYAEYYKHYDGKTQKYFNFDDVFNPQALPFFYSKAKQKIQNGNSEEGEIKPLTDTEYYFQADRIVISNFTPYSTLMGLFLGSFMQEVVEFEVLYKDLKPYMKKDSPIYKMAFKK